MDTSTFTCTLCHGTYEKGWSDEEAQAEYVEKWPSSAAAGVSTNIVCDDCFKAMGFGDE